MILRFLTPLNLEEEREKFFASSRYVPVFKYDWKDDVVYKVRPRYRDLVLACMQQNEEEIVLEGKRVFGVELEEKELEQAKEIVKERKISRLSRPSVTEVVKKFEESFRLLGLDWKLEVRGLGFNFRPRGARRVLLMGSDISWEFFSLEGEIRHELVHIIRYENGEFNKIARDDDYLLTEEGLACYMHDFKGVEENYSLFQHAAEYLATKVALEGSLRDVVDFFRSLGFSKELAWQRGVRHKFGFVDTSMFGDIMKPAMYFYHELKVSDLSDEEKLRLMVGKVGYGYIDKVSVYSGKIDVNKLIDFYDLSV